MLGAPWWPYGGLLFLMSEVTLYPLSSARCLSYPPPSFAEEAFHSICCGDFYTCGIAREEPTRGESPSENYGEHRSSENYGPSSTTRSVSVCLPSPPLNPTPHTLNPELEP